MYLWRIAVVEVHDDYILFVLYVGTYVTVRIYRDCTCKFWICKYLDIPNVLSCPMFRHLHVWDMKLNTS